MPEDNEADPVSNIFEIFLRDLALKFDPKDLTLTLKFPSLSSFNLGSNNIKKIPKQVQSQSSHVISLKSDENNFNKRINSNNSDQDLDDDYDIVDLGLEDLDPDSDPPRVKIHLKAYIRIALHSLKYANPKVPQSKWVEVIGLLTGHIENKDTPLACLVITDAYPIGHGTNVNAQIQNPQSMVRVFNETSKKNQIILGWYHSHPSYGAFMSSTDFHTQVRYQRLGSKGSQLTAPVALVIDPTRISNRSYGFKIFRLKKDMKSWEEPRFEVLNCSLQGLPELISTLLPLSEGKAMFLEYDHD
ncbi:MAG: Mov34/MPN/PAD-1 family protein [Candidatus Hodarchaeales archaeon]|jgi:proteasome lid subunit RPN8/RPN11